MDVREPPLEEGGRKGFHTWLNKVGTAGRSKSGSSLHFQETGVRYLPLFGMLTCELPSLILSPCWVSFSSSSKSSSYPSQRCWVFYRFAYLGQPWVLNSQLLGFYSYSFITKLPWFHEWRRKWRNRWLRDFSRRLPTYKGWNEDLMFSLHSYWALSSCFSSALENVSSEQPIQKRELRGQERDGSVRKSTWCTSIRICIPILHTSKTLGVVVFTCL